MPESSISVEKIWGVRERERVREKEKVRVRV